MPLTKRLDFIRRLIKAGAKPKLYHGLEKLGVQESAYILRQLGGLERRLCFEALEGHPLLGAILKEFPDDIIDDVLSSLEVPQLSVVLSAMPAEWIWSYLQNVPEEKREAVVALFPQILQQAVRKIAQYPKESCGEIMHPDFLCVKDTATVEEVIVTLRSSDSQMKIFYLYVVDEENHLLGTVPLRSLLRGNPGATVAQVMITTHVAVQALDSRERAAQAVSQHKLLAVPVVDESHHLLGVIRVDDVIDIVQDEATEEMYRMAGLTKDDRILAPWLKTARKRLIWMSINLGTAFLAAWTVGLFQESIAKVVALAVFMPVVAGMGGNGGTQSLTVMTRALAMGEIGRREIWRILLKEVVVGLMVGGLTGVLTGLIAWSWQGNFYLGLVLWMAMTVNMMIAGFAGAVTPMLLRALRSDPALGSGVLVTTVTDVFGFLTFLGLATLFLKYLI